MIADVAAVGLIILLGTLSLLALYQWAHAIVSIVSTQRYKLDKLGPARRQLQFLVLIPAHNEEWGIGTTLQSLADMDYPKDLIKIVVVADRCTDGTARVVRSFGADCYERTIGPSGKGAALSWAIDQAKSVGLSFDALVVIDADCLVHKDLIAAFNQALLEGHEIQQGFNYISNPWDSYFTRIIAVTGVLKNGLYYQAKTALGLPGVLTGTGMSFSRRVIDQYGWNAHSVAEDWEFSTALLLAGEKVYYNPLALTLAKESQGLKQASTQRLRWAGGRYGVIASSARKLFLEAIRSESLYLLDAAITLVAPNYSSQASMSILCVGAAWLFSTNPLWWFLLPWALIILGSLTLYFLVGVCKTSSPRKALEGLLLVPLFLPWRLVIEILGILGYGRKGWVRDHREHLSNKDPVVLPSMDRD